VGSEMCIRDRGGKMQNTNAECIDVLMEKSRAHLAVPVDTKQVAAKTLPSEEKT
jgi:hypothetical protein